MIGPDAATFHHSWEPEMGEQENVKVVREMFEGFRGGDVARVLDLLSEDVEWQLGGPTEIAYAGVRHGRQKVAEFFKLLGEQSEFEEFDPREYIAQGERVVVLGHERHA